MIDPQLHHHLGEIKFFSEYLNGLSYFGIFLVSILMSYLIPLPEVVALILFGFMARVGGLNIFLVLFWSSLGGIIGDNLVYRLSYFGNRFVERFNRKMRSHKLIKYEYLVKDNIGKAIYFLRFVVGVRFFGPVIAGTLGIRWRKFLPFNASATILNAIIFVLLGYFFHRRIVALIINVEIIKNILLFCSVFIVGILVSVFYRKGRNE